MVRELGDLVVRLRGRHGEPDAGRAAPSPEGRGDEARQSRAGAQLQDAPPADEPTDPERELSAWCEAQLASPQEGVTTVLFHSIVWQYLGSSTRHRVKAAIEEAGRDGYPAVTLNVRPGEHSALGFWQSLGFSAIIYLAALSGVEVDRLFAVTFSLGAAMAIAPSDRRKRARRSSSLGPKPKA